MFQQDAFSTGTESVSFFGSCPTQAPSAGLIAPPSSEPSLLPSASPVANTISPQPTADFCDTPLKDKFELIMTTNDNPTENSFKIFVREFGEFNRAVFTKEYTSAVTDDSTTRCLFNIYCFKLVVYDTGSDGLNGLGSYQAYWNGK